MTESCWKREIVRPNLRPADQAFERITVRHCHQRHVVGRFPPALEIVGDRSAHRLNGPVLLRCDVAAAASTGTGRGGSSVSGGDTANDNEIMAPAAMATPLNASSCIACIAGIVCAIRGTGMAGTARQRDFGTTTG